MNHTPQGLMAMTSDRRMRTQGSSLFPQRLVPSAPIAFRSPLNPKKLNLERHALSAKNLENTPSIRNYIPIFHIQHGGHHSPSTTIAPCIIRTRACMWTCIQIHLTRPQMLLWMICVITYTYVFTNIRISFMSGMTVEKAHPAASYVDL